MKSPFLSHAPLASGAFACLLVSAQLHAAPAGVPDAGSILQQMQPVVPAEPSSNRPALQVTPADTTKLPASRPFDVKHIRITGNTLFTTAELHALLAGHEGKQLTLAQMEELAALITAYYQKGGYPLSRAIIPAQTIKDGIVIIQVVEAHYGAVRLNNSSKVNTSLLNSILAPLKPGAPVAGTDLDTALLQLSDLPGVGLNAVLKPGSEVGTSDLDVVTVPVTTSFANLVLDNYGNRYIGRPRLGGTYNIFNPFGQADTLSANLVTTGNGLNYGRISYDILLNGAGTRAGVAYSSVHYKLGDTLRALDAHGTADVASAWLRHPLLRSRQANVYAQLQYDSKQLRDRIDLTSTHTDRKLDNWILSVNGDLRDSILSGGVNIWSLAWTNGRVKFEDANAQALDAVSAKTSGRFSKWTTNYTRLQTLAPRDTLQLNISGQWADSNLDSAEKMAVGGPYSVRAYDIGVLSADTGYFGSVEWRHDLGQFAAGRLQTAVFVESTSVKVNHRPWTTSKNSATLSGTGLGVVWEGPDAWRATASIATRLGDVPSLLAAQASTRGWVTVSKAF